jgi:membrane-bound lytic murein transglycosylase B
LPVKSPIKFNLITVILGSSLLAVFLNCAQFAASYAQRQAAFAPAWAYTADTTPSPLPAATLAAAQIPPAQSPTGTATQPAAIPGAPAATDPIVATAAALTKAGLNPDYASLYLEVQAKTGTPWQLLAAVHRVETGQSGSTSRTSYAGATGPMQFMPATFNHYALDGNGDGIKDIHNLQDSMLTAGHYLAVSGATTGSYQKALFNYNHSDTYVSNVMAIAHRLGL